MKKPLAYILSCLTITALILTLFLPRMAKFGYDYKKGKAWGHETLYAQFDFPILKTENEMLEEMSGSTASVIPYYRMSDEVVNKNIQLAEGLNLGSHKKVVISAMRSLYEKGIMSDEGVKRLSHSDKTDVIFIQKDKRASKCPVSEVYKVSDARSRLLAEVTAHGSAFNYDSLFRREGVYDLIVPNLIYDRQTTELVGAEAKYQVSPTAGYVSAGKLIVSEGEIVTAEIEQMLDSYKTEFEANLGYSGPKILFWLGNAILAFLIVFLLYFVIRFTSPGIFNDSRFLYILLIFLLASVITMIVARIREDLLYMVPYTLFALLLQAFFKPKVIVPVYIVSLMPLLVFTHNGLILFVMHVIAGVFAIYCFQYLGRGWKQFVLAGITFLLLSLTYWGFHLLDIATANFFRIDAYLFVASMLAVAGYPLIYLFEKLFNLVSNSRLSELCDTSNPLLRQLEQKAPGTFQHALQVMNMADTVARAIGANSVLIRAGALYHDIGKMKDPMCFVENESLLGNSVSGTYHAGRSPKESAAAIIGHVSAGLELAGKNNLPKMVTDFIRTHHGNTLVRYFYNKYVNEGGDPSDTAAFCYNGMKPQTKEQLILMLCDSIEAASRTLTEHNPEAYSKFVEAIFEGKRSEGQFDEADISIRDLGIVREEIKQYLAQMHHERISYANKDKNKQ